MDESISILCFLIQVSFCQGGHIVKIVLNARFQWVKVVFLLIWS